jgi:hypothetical protein
MTVCYVIQYIWQQINFKIFNESSFVLKGAIRQENTCPSCDWSDSKFLLTVISFRHIFLHITDRLCVCSRKSKFKPIYFIQIQSKFETNQKITQGPTQGWLRIRNYRKVVQPLSRMLLICKLQLNSLTSGCWTVVTSLSDSLSNCCLLKIKNNKGLEFISKRKGRVSRQLFFRTKIWGLRYHIKSRKGCCFLGFIFRNRKVMGIVNNFYLMSEIKISFLNKKDADRKNELFWFRIDIYYICLFRENFL